MNKTTHYGINETTGDLVYLGVGENTKEDAEMLAYAFESVASFKGNKAAIGSLFTMADLYKLVGQANEMLNNLPTAELLVEDDE